MTRIVDPPLGKIKPTAITVKPNTWLGVLAVEPVNLAGTSDADAYALQTVFQDLLDRVPYPLYLYSRQHWADLDRYVDEVAAGPGYDELRRAYAEYCHRLSDQGFVETHHYLVVRVDPRKYGRPKEELHRRLTHVAAVLGGSRLDVDHVTGTDLQDFVHFTRNGAPEFSAAYCAVPNQVFDEYRKLVYIDTYPSRVGFGWPVHVLQVDGLVDVTQVFQPVAMTDAVKALRRRSERLSAEIDAARDAGRRGVNRMAQRFDETEWFLTLLARQECRPVRYGAYLTVHGRTPNQVDATMDQVDAHLTAAGFTSHEPGYRNDYAYYTDSPFHSDRLDETHLVPSTSAATGFPFGTQPFEDNTGVLYGRDAQDGTPILLNRFTWDSHSMAVMGAPGSGKSYLAHLELLRSMLVYPDLRIIVVDPKREYRATMEALGGDHRLIEHGNDYSFNKPVLGFEVADRGDFENVAALVELVRQIHSATSQTRDRTIVLVDEASLILEDDAGRHALNQFVLKARDINVAVHIVTQSHGHFTRSREGQDILANVPGKLFFYHEDAPASAVLTRREASAISGLKTGRDATYSEAYIHVSKVVHAKLKIGSTALEHRLFEAEPTDGDPIQVRP